MIILTRLHGQPFALNPDLIERADANPDTVLTLVDGTKYVVLESLPDLVRLVREHRASVLLAAHAFEVAEVPTPAAAAAGGSSAASSSGPALRVLRGGPSEEI